MGAKNSNLSDMSYRYDLVSALSQNTLNANLKQLLAAIGANETEISAYYRFIDKSTGPTRELRPEEVERMTGGSDVFELPYETTNKTTVSDNKQLGDAMLANGFAYAFKFTIGIPNMRPYDIPDVITLSLPPGYTGTDPSSTVQYHMYFRTFQVVLMTGDASSWKIINAQQPINIPWTFNWLVKLKMPVISAVQFDKLPVPIQKHLRKIYNLDTKGMFSLQQLILDLSSPLLKNGPDLLISGLKKDDPLYGSLTIFVDKYWQILRNHGGVILSNSVSPVQTSSYPPSSIVPTGLNFVMSPYSDTSKKNLDTLSYLVMANQSPMPLPIKSFNWNWVDDNATPGIMSVRGALFIKHLNSALSPSLKPLCQDIHVKLSHWGWDDPELKITPTTKDISYTQNAANPCLTFQFESKSEDDVWWFLRIVPNHDVCKVRINVSSTISLISNTIKCTTVASLYFEFESFASSTRGYPMALQNDTTFTLSAIGVNNDAGMLKINCETKITELGQTTDKNKPYYNKDLDPSWWAKVNTRGGVSRTIDVTDPIANDMKTLMDNYTKAISEIVTNSLGWVFPGAETFFFSEPLFSDKLDLTVKIAYQSVN